MYPPGAMGQPQMYPGMQQPGMIDPMTGQPMMMQQPGMIDPMTGQPMMMQQPGMMAQTGYPPPGGY